MRVPVYEGDTLSDQEARRTLQFVFPRIAVRAEAGAMALYTIGGGWPKADRVRFPFSSLAKARQFASIPGQGERGFQSVKSRFAECVDKITNTLNPINSRKELAAAAGVSESTYDAGKLIRKAVEEGTAEPDVIADVRTGKGSIHGVAKRLKAKPAELALHKLAK